MNNDNLVWGERVVLALTRLGSEGLSASWRTLGLPSRGPLITPSSLAYVDPQSESELATSMHSACMWRQTQTFICSTLLGKPCKYWMRTRSNGSLG